MQHTRLHLEQTESTNDVGGEWLKTATPGEILTVWTSNQTQGRGQRGNAWEQSPGLDLALTVAVKWPVDPPQNPVALNKAITASIRNAIAQLLHGATGVRSVGIKWPNDILIESDANRWLKCAGILIENTWRGTTWDGTLIGIGININSVHAGEQKRCALSEFASAQLSMEHVEEHLSRHVLAAIAVPDSLNEYDAHLVGRDCRNRLSFQGQTGMGKVVAVNADGALEMEWKPEGGTAISLTVDRSDDLTWDWLWKP